MTIGTINRSSDGGPAKSSGAIPSSLPTTEAPPPSNAGTAATLQHQYAHDISAYGGMAAGHLPESMRDTAAMLAMQQALSAANPTPSGPSRRESVLGTNIMVPGLNEDDNDDSDDDAPRGEKRAGRRKIRIEYIEDKSRRHITFSKRKAGIMKKAYELSTLTGTQVLLLVASETGHVYTFATPKLQPLITKPEGKNLIQACLNAPDVSPSDYPGQSNYDHGEDTGKENAYDERSSGGQNANIPVNYAAAMAGLAGFPYPSSNPNNNPAASAAFLSPAHYPAYAAAQYNAALAAGYWPGNAGSGQQTSSTGQPGNNNASGKMDPVNMASAAGQYPTAEKMGLPTSKPSAPSQTQ